MGSRFVVGIRLNVEEFAPGGLTLQDARVIAKRLIAAGVKLLEVSAEAKGNVPVAQFPGWRVPLAAGIKAVVDVPVIVGALSDDVLLADSVIREGSADPSTLGVKMTVYRVGDDTPFVRWLIMAAESGKQVACVIELKARFDENRNLHWADALLKVGAHVSFGVLELKIHAKVALVVRQEGDATSA